jgi:hypothetical protein
VKPRLHSTVSLMLFFALLAWSLPAFSQSKSNDNSSIAVKILSIKIKKVKVRDRGIRAEGMSLDNKSTFLRITAEYYLSFDGKGSGYGAEKYQWVDRLNFSWAVVLAGNETGKGLTPAPRHSLVMKKNITYGNVRASSAKNLEKHYAVVYVEPKVLERMNPKMLKKGAFVSLKIYLGNTLAASDWARGSSFTANANSLPTFFPPSGKGGWFGAKNIKMDNDSLRSRHQTPWTWSSYGTYEAIIFEQLLKNKKK